MTITSEREYKKAMANPIETARNRLAGIAEKTQAPRDYMGDLGNRIIGRDAWMEPDSDSNPAWTRYLITGCKILYPFALSKQIIESPILAKYMDIKTHAYADFGITMALIGIETLLWAPTILLAQNHQWEAAVGLRIATTAVVHVGLDVISAAAKRFRGFRPSGTTLAV